MKSRSERAMEIVERHAGWAVASGVLPVPLLDVAALTLVNVRMLEQIAEVYQVPFSSVRAGSHVASLLGSLGAAQVAWWMVRAGVSFVPGIGPLLAAVPIAATGGSITYAIGKIFIRQFEKGGTFADFNPKTVRREEILRPDARPGPDDDDVLIPEVVALPPAGRLDDLTLVKGIGPKIASLLAEKGVRTFADLASTTVVALQTILAEAGVHYAYHDPSTWPEQGRLLAAGELDLLADLQSRMPR